MTEIILIIYILLCILLLFIPNLDNNNKYKLTLLTNGNIISLLVFINLICFSLLENTKIGLILILIFCSILSIKKKDVKEGFFSYNTENTETTKNKKN